MFKRLPRKFTAFVWALTPTVAVLWSMTCQPRGKPSASENKPRIPPSPRATRSDPVPPPGRPAAKTKPKAPPKHPAAKKLPLTLTLFGTPRTLTLAQRSSFRIRFSARNNGTKVVDPQLFSVELLVNGKRSMSWMLAIGNGPRSKQWRALSPGESVGMGWPLGKALFPKPGAYTLVLRQGATTSASIKITVLP